MIPQNYHMPVGDSANEVKIGNNNHQVFYKWSIANFFKEKLRVNFVL